MHLRGYTWRPVEGLSRDPKLDVINGVILHVDAGNATSLFNYFNGPSGGIESHAFIPKSAKHNKEQYRDTTHEADANYLANSWIGEDGKRHGFISVETQGYGTGIWTPYQMRAIKDLIVQCHQAHKFPLKVPQQPKGYGVGFHTLFPEWSNVKGKVCPGAGRKDQFYEHIVPWLAQRGIEKYRVKEQDTAPGIAKKFGMTPWELWRLNPGIALPLEEGQTVNVS